MPRLSRPKEQTVAVQIELAYLLLENPEITPKQAVAEIKRRLGSEYEWVTSKWLNDYSHWRDDGGPVQMFRRHLKLETKDDHLYSLTQIERGLIASILKDPLQLDRIKPARKVELIGKLSGATLELSGQLTTGNEKDWELKAALAKMLKARDKSQLKAATDELEIIAYGKPLRELAEPSGEPAAPGEDSACEEIPVELHEVAPGVFGVPSPGTVAEGHSQPRQGTDPGTGGPREDGDDSDSEHALGDRA